MDPQKTPEDFLNFLRSQINRNEIQEEEKTLNQFSQNPSFRDIYRKIFRDVLLLEYLKNYIADPDINEIILHDNENIQLEICGRLKNDKIYHLSQKVFYASLDILALRNMVTWNFSNPFACFYIELERISFRATMVHESTGLYNKSKLFLRKIRATPFPLTDFGILPEISKNLINFIIEKKNILIAGAAGSGKSSLLSSLIKFIPEHEHVIILEDTHEIINKRENNTHFLGNENLTNKNLKDLCTFSLRLRPDRIIIGEIRSSEILTFILAMNTGHRGMITTLHADSASESISRMAILFLLHHNNNSLSYETVLKLICKNIDIVIYLKNKKIIEIIKIIGSDRGTVNFDYLFRNN